MHETPRCLHMAKFILSQAPDKQGTLVSIMAGAVDEHYL